MTGAWLVSGAMTLAAGPYSGLAIDGRDQDPVSGGIQAVFQPPGEPLIITDASAGRDSVSVAIADWAMTIATRDGLPLAAGQYSARSSGGDWHVLDVSGPGGSCEASGYFKILELVWSGDTPTVLAVDFNQACDGTTAQLTGSLRVASSMPVLAVATEPDEIDLGATIVGTPLPPQPVTYENIGQEPLQLGMAYVDTGPQVVDIVDDACSQTTLAVGSTCQLSVRLSGQMPGLQWQPMLYLPDGITSGTRAVRLRGVVEAPTTTVVAVDPVHAYWPGPTFVEAVVSPAPDGGTITFHYDDGAGTSGSFEAPGVPSNGRWTGAVEVPRGTYTWAADYGGWGAFRPSQSDPLVAHVGVETAVTLEAATHPIGLGEQAVLRATVAAADGLPLPTGVLTIKDEDGATVGSGAVGGTDVELEAVVAGLPLGVHQFRAAYVSTEDGGPSQAGFRLSVMSQGIEAVWAAKAPAGSGSVSIDHVAIASSGLFVAGHTWGELVGETSSGQSDLFLASYSTDGEVLWAHQFGTPGVDQALSLVATPDSVYVGGTTESFWDGTQTTDRVSFVTRLTPTGSVLWRREITGPDNYRASIAAAVDGGVVTAVTGWQASDPDDGRPGIVRHYRPDGSTAWQAEILGCCPGSPYGFYGSAGPVSADPGGVTVGGWRSTTDPARPETLVRRYDWGGRLLWTATFPTDVGDIVVNHVVASSATLWIGGVSNQPITGTPNLFPEANPFVRRYTFGGGSTWTRAIVTDRLVADCASFVTVGGVAPDPDTIADVGAYVTKLDADGTPQWRWEVAGSATTRTDFNDVAPDDGRVYLLVSTTTQTTSDRQLVALEGVPPATDCDTRPPTVTPPSASLLSGSAVSQGKVSVRLAWSGSDPGGSVARYELAQRIDGGGWVRVDNTAVTQSAVRYLAPGHAYRFRVRAVDRAGNVGSWVAGPTFDLRKRSEASRRIGYRGTWRTVTGQAYLGGAARLSKASGATASMTFTGRSFAWLARRGPDRGRARIFVNGSAVATVDLRATNDQPQRLVWSRTWSTAKPRTITIRVEGTPGRPRVELDAIFTIE